MNNDKLENFISNHREGFDDKEPPALLWEAIRQDLDKKPDSKVFPLRFLLTIAAGAAILLCVGLVIGLQMAKPDLDQRIVSVHPDFLEAERHYQQQVNLKLNQAKILGGDKHISTDLHRLDAVYQELRQELLDNGVQSDEFIIEAMIEHYQSKLEVLEVVLEKLEDNNTTIKRSDYENVEY